MIALRLILTAALLAAVWYWADGRAALARLAGADPLWLALAFAALHGQTLLSALRWRLTATALGMPMAQGHALREYYMAQAVNQTLPGGVLGDAARAVRARGQAGLPRAAGAVVLERLAGQGALIAVLAAGLCLAALAPGGIAIPAAAAIPLGAVLALVALRAWRHHPRLSPLWQSATTALFAPGLWPRQAALSLAIVALNLLSFACAARATGTALGLTVSMVLIPLILFAMLLPFGIGGWGWREGASAALFPLTGAAPEAGLAASAAFGALVLAAALPGFLWLTPKGTRA